MPQATAPLPPGPWIADLHVLGWHVFDADGRVIATTPYYSVAAAIAQIPSLAAFQPNVGPFEDPNPEIAPVALGLDPMVFQELSRIFDVNVVAPLALTRLALPLLNIFAP